MRTLLILGLLLLVGCAPFREKYEISNNETKITLIDQKGKKVFSNKIDGSYDIRIQGADVTIQFLPNGNQ